MLFVFSIRVLFAYILEHVGTCGKFELVTNVSHTSAEVCIKRSHIFQMIRGMVGNIEVPFSNGARICDPRKLLPSNFLPCCMFYRFTRGLILIEITATS